MIHFWNHYDLLDDSVLEDTMFISELAINPSASFCFDQQRIP